ncbi:acyl carrier protein [Plastoroseomonas hellenica]|uniref:acyl carrier protein n=1 Tax=Plastoroseomonas hellenica TaxID=2687306 RepID=UPI001FEC1F64|nr:acyl carrier protein [Plastoroseomonas hellenica]
MADQVGKAPPDVNRRASEACQTRRFGAWTGRESHTLMPRRRATMASAFERIADIIAENSEVKREDITPDSHVINDLGIDSLDFLDIVFAIDKAFGIKVPVEAWTQEVNAGTAPAEQYFVMKNLAARIDELVAAKQA